MGEIVEHYYSSAGNYTVNLTVTDDREATNSIFKTIRVIEKGIFDTGSLRILILLSSAYTTEPSRHTKIFTLRGCLLIHAKGLAVIRNAYGLETQNGGHHVHQIHGCYWKKI